ncbi:MAG: PIG-L deacetylase family protein [Terracidiphilus sp.]
MSERVLVIAPHADDEVLGAGGTIARFTDEGAEVSVIVLTGGFPPDFAEEEEDLIRREAVRAHDILKVKKTIYLDFPAAALDTVAHRELNYALSLLYKRICPTIVFVPFLGDVHLDHQAAFQSAMVMCRPTGGHLPHSVLAYETISETNWNASPVTPGFLPNTYVDISDYLETKLAAFQAYASQVCPFPHERSLETMRALAVMRGSTVHLKAAEAFVALRNII